MLKTPTFIFLLSALFIFGSLSASGATITVNTIVDENGTGANCSLREAINAANTDAVVSGCAAGSGTDTITITSTGLLTLSSSLPAISSNMTVNGPGVANLAISGNNTVRIMTINALITVTISNMSFINGNASGSQGGAIESDNSVVTLQNCIFSNNQATFDGGAVRNNGGNMTITNCQFNNNTSGVQGGAVKQNGTAININGSTFYRNSANAGGSLHIGNGSTNTTVTNSTFYENTASFGGAIESRALSSYTNCTISGNVASATGGLSSLFAQVTVRNTIIAGNRDPNGNQSDIEVGSGGSFNLAGSPNNLIGSAGGSGFTNGVNGNQVGVASPYLAPLGNYGGPTQTMPPTGQSGAINSGTNTGIPAVDQRGAARTSGGGDTDIGAVEVNFVVNLDTDTSDTTAGDGSCDTSGSAGAQCTLRAAIQEATAFAGDDVIAIDLPAPSTITPGTVLPTITTNMAILGSGKENLTINANNAFRNFFINGPIATLASMRIANGFSTSEGGCIRTTTVLTLSDVTVDGCTSNLQAGAIDVLGTLSIIDSTISNSTALAGDGGGIATFGVLNLTNSTITGNSVPSGNGGGVAVMNGGANQGSVIAVNSTFSSNTASASGGAVFFDTTMSNTITNCTITLNSQTNVGQSGGGFGIPVGANVLLKNSIVAQNTQNGGGQSNITGTVAAGSSFNLIGAGGTGGLTNGVNGNQVGVASAGLAPLGSYGGRTRTHALTPTSPAVNTGTNSGAPTTDQRGAPRPFGTTDIGAFEHFITVSPATLPAGSVGGAYAQTYSASGGTGAFPTAELLGTLPTGMSFNPGSFELAGTPTQLGIFPICVSITDSFGFAGVRCHDLVISSGPLHHFAISNISSPQTAGTPFSITITAQDIGNNTVTSFVGSINLTTNAGTISPTTTGAFIAGVRTLNVSVTQAGTLKTIGVNDGSGHTGTSNTFDVNAGALHHFAIATISGSRTAGTPFNIDITAQDLNNNTVTGFTGMVNLTTNQGTINPTVSGAFTSGARTQSVTLTSTGAGRTIGVNDGAGHTATSNSFQVLVPTAAGVSVSGRVLTAAARGLGNTAVTLTNSAGISRRVITSPFGYYRFDDVQAGAAYVITASAKTYRFTPRVINVSDELSGIDLIANGDGKVGNFLPRKALRINK